LLEIRTFDEDATSSVSIAIGHEFYPNSNFRKWKYEGEGAGKLERLIGIFHCNHNLVDERRRV
jgi:hypothetical protein